MCDDEEELIRYHFGDMTEEESAQFEHRLANEPGLDKRLEKLLDCLGASTGLNALTGLDASTDANSSTPINDDELSSVPSRVSSLPEIDAPAGLADRVAAGVADSVADLRLEDLQGDTNKIVVDSRVTPSQPCRFSFFDAAAAVFALVLIALIVSPSLLNSREAARRDQCQRNLAELGSALRQYAFDHGEQFPHLLPYENAGMFTVTLAEAGYLPSNDLQKLVVCPASQLADEIMNRTAIVWVPSRYEFQTTPALLAERAKQFMSGSYAYRIGYFENGKYVQVKHHRDSRSPLLCDAPSPNSAQRMSPHHAEGQHILFQDGSTKFQTSCQSPCRNDHLFLNNDGEVAPGKNWQDAVLVRSEVTPWPFSTVSLEK